MFDRRTALTIPPARKTRAISAGVERLESRHMPSAVAALSTAAAAAADPPSGTLTRDDVTKLLARAAAATKSDNAIVAVVDRNGDILGVRVESGVSPAITSNPETLTFAIDGAVSEARTGAFFANDQAPLTSRTVQFISQSTVTQREVQSDPNIPDLNSSLRGPGFVAPVGIKGHFPPKVMFTPQVDLFAIENTNRDSIVYPGPDGIKGTPDDVTLPSRFNVPTQFVPAGVHDNAPESYGFVSGLDPSAQSRGIGTLPGGVPLFRRIGNNFTLLGGIGVFFPGTTGFATEENSKLNAAPLYDPKKLDLSQEAELIGFAAAGGSREAGVPVGTLGGVPTPDNFDIPFGRLDLVGITLDTFGGHGLQGVKNLLVFGQSPTVGFGQGNPNSGVNEPVNTTGETILPGETNSFGWLVTPHDGVGITAADVVDMVNRGIAEANQVRAAIRLPLDSTAKMVFAVTDNTGAVLGLYRMPDATYFSIGVAVAKARNVAYYANPALLQPQDRISNVPLGTAFTNRTIRYVTLPHFPQGIDFYPPGPFSILNDGGVVGDGLTNGTPLPASAFQSVQGFDAFNPDTNFHDPANPLNQNGVVFFPGSTPLYKTINGTRQLVGGLGVSGDGVDQDDDVTYEAGMNFQAPPPGVPTADEVKVRGVRLPYIKFNRQPHEPLGQPPLPRQVFVNLPYPRPRPR
jgi:uncharacterized protein GlcG (DUF336 family)